MGETRWRVLRQEHSDTQCDRHRNRQSEHRTEHGDRQEVTDTETQIRCIAGDEFGAGEEVRVVRLQRRDGANEQEDGDQARWRRRSWHRHRWPATGRPCHRTGVFRSKETREWSGKSCRCDQACRVSFRPPPEPPQWASPGSGLRRRGAEPSLIRQSGDRVDCGGQLLLERARERDVPVFLETVLAGADRGLQERADSGARPRRRGTSSTRSRR